MGNLQATEKMSKCTDCDTTIDWDGDGGFLWEGMAFCDQHDPEKSEEVD